MSDRILVHVSPEGLIRFLYADEARNLRDLGDSTIVRASHVEPNPDGTWSAAMVGGPILGPYATRREALDAEIAWLNEKVLDAPAIDVYCSNGG